MLRLAVRPAAKSVGASTVVAASSRAFRAAAASTTTLQPPASPSASRPGSSLQQVYEQHTAAAMGDASHTSSGASDSSTDVDPLVAALSEHLAGIFSAQDAAASRMCAGTSTATSAQRLGANGTGGSCAPRNSAREQAQGLALLLERSAARHHQRGL